MSVVVVAILIAAIGLELIIISHSVSVRPVSITGVRLRPRAMPAVVSLIVIAMSSPISAIMALSIPVVLDSPATNAQRLGLSLLRKNRRTAEGNREY